jgi:hypothetical protein
MKTTHKGVFIDAGRITDAVADELRKEVLNAYPKPTDGPYIADAIIAHGQRSPAAAPPGSLAAHLILQQRQLETVTAECVVRVAQLSRALELTR